MGISSRREHEQLKNKHPVTLISPHALVSGPLSSPNTPTAVPPRAQAHPEMLRKLLAMMRSQPGEWGDADARLHIRCIELHSYAPGGGLITPVSAFWYR